MSPRREVISAGGDAAGSTDAADRPLDPAADLPEEAFEAGLRPRRLADFVGQGALREHLEIVLEAARMRGQAVDHLTNHGFRAH